MNSHPRLRRFLKPLLVMLVAGLTLSAYAVATPADGQNQETAKPAQPQLAALRVSEPSTFSFIGVGGISLIGMLAMRRRFRTVRG